MKTRKSGSTLPLLALFLTALLGAAAVAGAQQSAIDEAIRHARETFERSDDEMEKSRAALHLVAYGVEDPRYLQWLLDNAWEALEGDPPGVLAVDEAGRTVRGELSEEFVAWAAERGLDPETAAGERLYGAVAHVAWLASVATTDRPATVDLLLHALEARDPMIVSAAADGLARLRVESARERLQEIALSSPDGDLAKGVAVMLLRFDHPEAQAVAEKVLDDPELVASLRAAMAHERRAPAEGSD